MAISTEKLGTDDEIRYLDPERTMQHFRDESFHKAAIHNKKYKRRALELAKRQRTLALETAAANPTILGRNTQIELQMCTSNATASIMTDHRRATTSNEKQQQEINAKTMKL